MSHLNILGARRVTWSKFHTEDPHILSTKLKLNHKDKHNVKFTKISRRVYVAPWFVHLCTHIHTQKLIYLSSSHTWNTTQLMTLQSVLLRLRFQCQGNKCWWHVPLFGYEEDYCAHCCLQTVVWCRLKRQTYSNISPLKCKCRTVP
jgi:hypothetical protein